MSTIRRRGFLGLLGSLGLLSAEFLLTREPTEKGEAVPRRPAGSQPHPAVLYSGPGDDRYASRKTPDGLQPIEWEEIEPGMEIVLMDWGCGIDQIIDCGRAQELLEDGSILFESRCTVINCRSSV